jgi:hypothetical protein
MHTLCVFPLIVIHVRIYMYLYVYYAHAICTYVYVFFDGRNYGDLHLGHSHVVHEFGGAPSCRSFRIFLSLSLIAELWFMAMSLSYIAGLWFQGRAVGGVPYELLGLLKMMAKNPMWQ